VCSRAAWDLDEVLEETGARIADFLGRTGKTYAREAERIHPYAARIRDWFDNGDFPQQGLPAFEEERQVHETAISTLRANEEDSRSYYVVLLRRTADLILQNIKPKAA
jgi:hypothetical protein